MNTNALAAELAAIAHAHYVTPSTTDQGPSEALIERMRERLKQVAALIEYAHENVTVEVAAYGDCHCNPGDTPCPYCSAVIFNDEFEKLFPKAELRKAVDT